MDNNQARAASALIAAIATVLIVAIVASCQAKVQHDRYQWLEKCPMSECTG